MEKESEIFHKRPEPILGKAVPSPIGAMNYNVLTSLLFQAHTIRLNEAAEIGTFEAETAAYLLRSFPELRLHCVDPYLGYESYEPDKTQERMSEVERKALNNLAVFGDRVIRHKKRSVEAAKGFSDGSLDFVFIDALHTFDAVSEDLEAWYPKVRKGGIVSGHDYSWPGVREALECFLEKTGRYAFHSPSTSDIWFFEK